MRDNCRKLSAQAASICIAIFAWTSIAQAYTQLEPSSISQLHRQGFSDRDIGAAETLQVAPHFAFYHDWHACWMQSAQQTFMDSGTAQAARALAVAICSDERGYLRASLARDIGLPEAERVIELSEAESTIEFEAAYAKQHPARPAGADEVSGWKVVNPQPARCAASKASDDPLSPEAIAIVIDHGKAEINFIIGGDDGRYFKLPPNGLVAMSATRWTPQMNATSIGTLQLRVHQVSNHAVLTASIDQNFMSALAGASSLVLQGDLPRPPFSFQIEGIEQAWTAVQKCSGA